MTTANALVPLSGTAVPAAFAGFSGPNMNANAQQGLLPSFAVIGFKGSNWRLKYRGEEILVKDARGLPEQALDVVIVGVSPNISKQWYSKRFTEGDDAAPDCFSINGIHPDPASPKKQCETCAVCPQNLWGSRITEAGKKAKSCQDSRRLAVVPVADILNADFGGPMMLRLPPTSLSGLASFAKELDRFGAQPFMVQCQLSFDTSVAYPLIQFKATRWVNDEEAEQIKEVLADKQIERMLQEEVSEATHDPAAASPLMEGKPAAALVGAQPAAAPAAPAPVAPPPAPEPVAQPATAAAPAVAAKKASPFAASAQPAPAATTVAATPETAQVPTEVQQAPSDLNSMIDDLLKG